MSDIWLQYEHHRPDCEFNTEACEVCACMERNMADTITALTARVAELEDSLDRRKLARRLVASYNDSPLRIAELCDGAIDPTGRLLGYVRDEARAALTPHTYGEDMSNITIPPAVLEAARLAVAKAIIEDKDGIEAACLAMLRAWPGMSTRTGIYTDIILPLTETPDDHND